MNATAQSVATDKNPFASAFGVSSLVLVLLLAVFLHVLGVSVTIFAPLLGALALLCMAVRYPLGGLGACLAFMPVYPVAMLLGKFFGPSYMMFVSGFDRVILLLFACILWWRNGIKLRAPDWLLLAAFGFAVLRSAFGGTPAALLSDFSFMIAYAAGRLVALTENQEKRWARRAVWIVAVLSILGMTEVFVFGQGPRAALYLAVADQGTEGGRLNAVFHADGFAGLRESSTMFAPLTFGSLCMVALVIWWVYCRNPLPAGMIAAGLVCSVTRSAWLGTILAIPVLAVLMKQRQRFFLYAGLGLALFVVSIPLLGLGDYLLMAKSGDDYSTQGHRESILKGLVYVSEHPLGTGPGTAGVYATKNNANGVFIEDTYETLAAEYGIPVSLFFVAFLLSFLRLAWREQTPLGYAGVGIVVGFGAVMVAAPLHQDFPLASWIWFPVGLAVRASIALQDRGPGSGTAPLPVTR
jgi:hypothetical protein